MAVHAITREGYVIVVEGYMDAISVSSAGIKNVVASLGTAFTEEQAKILIRYTRKIYFCYDSDEAGQRATLRALPIVTENGAKAQVITMPDGKDPDEYIKNHGVDAFKQLIKNSKSEVDYRLEYFMKSINHATVEGKAEIVKQILPILASLSDEPVRQSEYCRRVAAAIIVNEEALREELKQYLKKGKNYKFEIQNSKIISSQQSEQKTKSVEQSTQSKSDDVNFANTKSKAIWTAGRFILKLAWQNNDTIDYALSIVPKEAFPNLHQEIIDYIKDSMDKDEAVSDVKAAQMLSPEALKELSKLQMENELDTNVFMDGYTDSLYTLKERWLKANYDNVMRKAMKISKEKANHLNDEKFNELIKESHVLRKQVIEYTNKIRNKAKNLT